ncbi:MAG TPA: hypothetical protein VGK02_05535 [Candidatus Aquicultor sp.]|jgi:hypothetical protein
MRRETVNQTTVAFSFVISAISSAIAIGTGGDIFTVMINRFLVVFAMSAGLIWLTLTAVNSVVIGAARAHVNELREELAQEEAQKFLARAKEEASKGSNLDITSVDDISLDFGQQDDTDMPAVKEFEPFRPMRLGSDEMMQ